jgi:hypothetical protein
MSKQPYSFTIDVPAEQKEVLSAIFSEGVLAYYHKKIDVIIGIFEILYRNGFRAFLNGMRRQETGCSFSWECLLKYKTVVDFQLDWPYS